MLLCKQQTEWQICFHSPFPTVGSVWVWWWRPSMCAGPHWTPPAFVPCLTAFHSPKSLFSAQSFIFFFFYCCSNFLVLVLPVLFQDQQQPLLCPLGKPHDHKWLDRAGGEARGIFHSTACQVFRVGVWTTQSLMLGTHTHLHTYRHCFPTPGQLPFSNFSLWSLRRVCKNCRVIISYVLPFASWEKHGKKITHSIMRMGRSWGEVV